MPGLNSNLADVNITFKKDAQIGDSSGSIARGISGQYNVDSGVTGINIDKCYNAGHNWDINGEATITRCYHANILIIDGTTSSVLIA